MILKARESYLVDFFRRQKIYQVTFSAPKNAATENLPAEICSGSLRPVANRERRKTYHHYCKVDQNVIVTRSKLLFYKVSRLVWTHLSYHMAIIFNTEQHINGAKLTSQG